MKRVMICQPMAGKTDEEILAERNKVRTELEQKGYIVINTFLDGDEYTEKNMLNNGVIHIPVFYLARSIEMLSKCDALYCCKNWNMGRGCRIERDTALFYELEIIYQE